jgi:hypothetical protein
MLHTHAHPHTHILSGQLIGPAKMANSWSKHGSLYINGPVPADLMSQLHHTHTGVRIVMSHPLTHLLRQRVQLCLPVRYCLHQLLLHLLSQTKGSCIPRTCWLWPTKNKPCQATLDQEELIDAME